MSGIPTKGPRDIIYRSRIEAQWAYILESLGWKYEYEPFDLNGYIPDFIVAGLQDILIEVKGDMQTWDEKVSKPYVDKIIGSGWTKPFVIVGASYDYCTNPKNWIRIGYGGHQQYIYINNEKTENKEWKLFEIVLIYNSGKWTLGKSSKNYNLKWLTTSDWKDSELKHDDFKRIWLMSKEKVRFKSPDAKCLTCDQSFNPPKPNYKYCSKCYFAKEDKKTAPKPDYKIETVAVNTVLQVPEVFHKTMMNVSKFTSEERMISLYAYSGKFIEFNADDIYIILTTSRLIKLEKGNISQVQRSRIRKVEHLKLGWFKWDRIQVTLDDGTMDSFGIYHSDACVYLCKLLCSSS